MFPSGLSMYKSRFLSADGSDGVVGGPHPEFTKAEKAHRGAHAGHQAYFHPTTEIYRSQSMIERDVPLLFGTDGSFRSEKAFFSSELFSISNVCVCRKQIKRGKRLDEVENAGTDISYRCIDCRNCPECKRFPRLENVSIQEEIEQSVIDRCVNVDVDKRVTTAALPFLTQPDLKLVPNDKSALKIYKAQARKLDLRPDDKAAVIDSEKKLQDLGFVDFYDNLTNDEKALFEGKLHNYIPWRVQWNLNYLSTAVKLVFDASHTSLGGGGGCSLNDLLAKGTNGMNLLVEIMVRWTTYLFAFHTDIQKMYNAILLHERFWRYQMYYWRDDLVVDQSPRRKVIKTLIYGNLAERGLRQTADIAKHLYPRAGEIIKTDPYVDDCMSGENSIEARLKTTDDLKLALEMGGGGGGHVKGFYLFPL